MERNDDFNSQNVGQGGTSGGGSGLGSTGAGSTGVGGGYGTGGLGGSTGTQNVGGTTGGSTGGSYGAGSGGVADRATDGTQNFGDQARDRLQQSKEAVTDKLGTLKEKAGNLNATLADKLEAGADKLRQRGQSGQLAGAVDASGGTAVASDDRMAQVGNRVASGMTSTADWLRNGDLQQTIESQVRTNPGRTLLIALGLGYVLGKAFRR